MSQYEPPMTIELLGPNPDSGQWFCATCCVLYMGHISADQDVQIFAQRTVEEAQKNGQKTVGFKLPAIWHKQIRQAITIAPSVYYPNIPLPVCWVHLQGATPVSAQSADQLSASRLIPGKDHRSRKEMP